MKTYILDTVNRFKRFSEDLDVKTTLCNKSWQVFNDAGEKEVYIFQESGNLIISVCGKVTNASWQYIPANKSLIISSNDQSVMVHPAFMDEFIFALQVDGTNQHAFLIDESNSQSFQPKTLIELNQYFQDKETAYLESKKAEERKEQLRLEQIQKTEQIKQQQLEQVEIEDEQKREEQESQILFEQKGDKANRLWDLKKESLLRESGYYDRESQRIFFSTLTFISFIATVFVLSGSNKIEILYVSIACMLITVVLFIFALNFRSKETEIFNQVINKFYKEQGVPTPKD